MYYEVNEETARRAHEAVHMSNYADGSATAEYRAGVDEIAALVAERKTEVSPYYWDKLDALADSYARKMADWTNAYNRNAASCVSWFISGPANYPVKKHERQQERERGLWEEYNEIQSIADKIRSVGTGPVELTDPHAREMLTERVEKLRAELERDKALNAWLRKHDSFVGCPELSAEGAAALDAKIADIKAHGWWCGKPYPDYQLASLRGKIKRTEERLAELDKLQAAQAAPEQSTQFDGGRIVRNAALERLQIVFDDVPDEATRAALKGECFHWPPTNKAWQRKLTANAERAAKRALKLT